MTTPEERSTLHDWLARSALDHDVTGAWCTDCGRTFEDRPDIVESISSHGPSRMLPGVRCTNAILFEMLCELEAADQPLVHPPMKDAGSIKVRFKDARPMSPRNHGELSE